MGLIKWTTGLVFAGLFVFCILMYATQFGADNNSAVLLSSDPAYTSLQNEINGNLTQVLSDTNISSGAFFTSSIKSGDVASESGGQFKAGVGTAKNLATSSLRAGFKKIFGNDSNFAVIFSVIGAVILFIGIMYAYSAWRGGSVD